MLGPNTDVVEVLDKTGILDEETEGKLKEVAVEFTKNFLTIPSNEAITDSKAEFFF